MRSRIVRDHSVDDESIGTLFRDLLFLLAMAFLLVAIVAIAHINPPGEKSEDEVPPPGSVIVAVRWADESSADVDLWVRGPDGINVGFSNKGGPLFNLLRDDLGRTADILRLNYENSYSRGLPEGEYIVNLHLFNRHSEPVPIKAQVQVSIRNAAGYTTHPLASHVDLLWHGHEVTVFRFRLDGDGSIISGSVNEIPYLMRPPRGGDMDGGPH